jgi:hypothetical protein
MPQVLAPSDKSGATPLAPEFCEYYFKVVLKTIGYRRLEKKPMKGKR